jgi:hypothetical protein
VLRVQALERGNNLLLADLERIGDHTRGLFEAEASVAMSAAHALQDIDILIALGHGIFLNFRLKKILRRILTAVS